ncbi:MAG: SDR family oxidoreductase [Promethearchaeota archaeon]
MSQNAKRIFFTGVTGFLGQFLAIELLKEGHFLIFLARGKKGLTAEERVSSALAFADIDTYISCQHMYMVVEKISKDIKAEEIYHVMGATSFAESEREAVFYANLHVTEEILELTKKIRPSAVHYISTAYICDPFEPIAYEIPRIFFKTYKNPYAQSKYFAEKSVLMFGKRSSSCKIFIYRPSIIVGRSWDGLTSNFFGYYRYMKAFFSIANVINRKNAKGKKIKLPIWVPGNPEADINIVTIDYVVDTMIKIRQKNISGIYHLTNDSPPTYGWLLEEGLKVLNILGPSPLRDSMKTPSNLRRLESKIEKGVNGYIPFVTNDVIFDKSWIRYVLGSDYQSHQPITSKTVRTLLEFAINCRFRKEEEIIQSQYIVERQLVKFSLPSTPIFQQECIM